MNINLETESNNSSKNISESGDSKSNKGHQQKQIKRMDSKISEFSDEVRLPSSKFVPQNKLKTKTKEKPATFNLHKNIGLNLIEEDFNEISSPPKMLEKPSQEFNIAAKQLVLTKPSTKLEVPGHPPSNFSLSLNPTKKMLFYKKDKAGKKIANAEDKPVKETVEKRQRPSIKSRDANRKLKTNSSSRKYKKFKQPVLMNKDFG
mmetsp:Transcript_13373/g.15505  ORF Transcript_13373/g.15505 Transcript_13373/m.15505 type:complete len:204 (-) Transcript_13373:621-1232(-)